MWLLRWLTSRAGRVINVISTSYSRIINAARNAYGWAQSAANSVRSALYTAITRVRFEIKHWVSARIGIIKWDLSQLIVRVNAIKDAIIGQVLRVVSGLISSSIVGVIVFVTAEIARVLAFFRDTKLFFDEHGFSLRALLRWYIRFIVAPDGLLRKILDYYGDDGLIGMLEFIKRKFGVLQLFLDQPLSFIIAYVRMHLLALLEFTIAYAMGTTKYTLPPWPEFIGSGYGGPIMYGHPPRTAIKGLVAPLDYLRVSGYPFSIEHPALDLGLSMGDNVYAMHDGKVEVAALSNVGYGYHVVIRGKVWWTRYAHNEVNMVKKGDRVKQGQVIAKGDSTGNSTGPHLHLEIKYKGQFVDPAIILFGVE